MLIDVCLVAGRRPALIRKTLESFDRNLFRNFDIGNVIANIDPIFGTEEEHEEVRNIILMHFRNARILEPRTPNFTLAVKNLWAQSTAAYLLHLEDDWLLHKMVDIDTVHHFQDDQRVAQISFNTKEKNWQRKRRGDYHYARRKLRILGIEMPIARKFPRFTTSPSFWRGDIARSVAAQMDTQFDPEKQLYSRVNKAIEAQLEHLRNYVIGDLGDFWIQDIGREWRNERGIEKEFLDLKSVWVIQ